MSVSWRVSEDPCVVVCSSSVTCLVRCSLQSDSVPSFGCTGGSNFAIWVKWGRTMERREKLHVSMQSTGRRRGKRDLQHCNTGMFLWECDRVRATSDHRTKQLKANLLKLYRFRVQSDRTVSPTWWMTMRLNRNWRRIYYTGAKRWQRDMEQWRHRGWPCSRRARLPDWRITSSTCCERGKSCARQTTGDCSWRCLQLLRSYGVIWMFNENKDKSAISHLHTNCGCSWRVLHIELFSILSLSRRRRWPCCCREQLLNCPTSLFVTELFATSSTGTGCRRFCGSSL